MKRITAIDSHTAGEPTRVVIDGAPDLGRGPITERLARLRQDHDTFRSAVVNEPRGSDVLVGAILLEPHEPGCHAAVIFFNNVGYLGMCGHGTIGLVCTLRHLGRLEAGDCRIETPVGIVTARLHPDGRVSVTNVPSWRKVKGARFRVPDVGEVTGDIAWGGNWFFLAAGHEWRLEISEVNALTEIAWRIRTAVNSQGFPEVDHVELVGPATAGGHARNFVLCPGRAYDRSPCGTGTSAKLACLAADGELPENTDWIQEGILGTTFSGRYQWRDPSRTEIVPVITGSAFVTAETTLLLDPRDPFRDGIPR